MSGKKQSDEVRARMSATHYAINQKIFMKQAIFDWLELREQNLKRLSYTSIGEAKLKYLAQIDFIETVRINIGAIIDKLETVKR